MGLILLEALLALFILVGIVWWTMFHGRPRGEPAAAPETPPVTVSTDAPGEALNKKADVLQQSSSPADAQVFDTFNNDTRR